MQILSEFECIVDKLSFSSGDKVKEGDTICSINVMKMLIEIPSPVSGVVHYHCKPDDYIMEGTIIATIDEGKDG